MLQQTDIRIAEEHAVFGLPEAKLGLIAGAGSTVRLKRQIPYTKAMEMILTGEPLTAAEAYHFGLVGHVVPTGQSLDKARQLAARVAANGPLAIRNAKASVINSGWIDEEEARRIEQRLVVEVCVPRTPRKGWPPSRLSANPVSPVSKRASVVKDAIPGFFDDFLCKSVRHDYATDPGCCAAERHRDLPGDRHQLAMDHEHARRAIVKTCG